MFFYLLLVAGKVFSFFSSPAANCQFFFKKRGGKHKDGKSSRIRSILDNRFFKKGLLLTLSTFCFMATLKSRRKIIMTADTQKALNLSLLSDQLAKLFGFADGVSDIVEHLFTIDSKEVRWLLLMNPTQMVST